MNLWKFTGLYVAASLVVVIGIVLTFFLFPLVVSLVWAALSLLGLRWLANKYRPAVAPRPAPATALEPSHPKSAGGRRKRHRRRRR